MSESGWDRRDFLGGAALLALSIGVPVAGVRLSSLSEDDLPSESQRRIVDLLAEAVIPQTATGGAGDAKVADFVILALAHGLDGTRNPVSSSTSAWGLGGFTRRDGSLRYLDWIEQRLDRAANGNWAGKPDADRNRILADLDAQSYPPGPPPADPSPWRAIKGLIVTGYYTSQIGGTEELRYQLVPGRYDPDLPLEPGTRSWSSDWIALAFG